MGVANLLFLFSGVIQTTPYPVFADVYIGTQGPYRFLVDTGAETSLIDSRLAAELRLQPEFRVEMITQLTKRVVPAANLRTLRVAQQTLPETEVAFVDVTEARLMAPSVKGVLGLNALSGLDFTLSPESGRLDLAAQRPEGEVVPFSRIEGRIAVKTQMGRESLTLILDSGSTHVVLFRTPAAMAKTRPVSATFTTLDGARSVVPTVWTADLVFTDRLRVGMLPAAVVERKGTQVEGLLPASIFKQVHVDQTRGELVLVR